MKAILALVEASASALLVKVEIFGSECSNINGELNSFLKYDMKNKMSHYFENKTVFLPLKINTGGNNAFDKQCFLFCFKDQLKIYF